MASTDTRARTARDNYRAKGWRPLPVPHGEKGPRNSDWPSRSFDESEFKAGDNTGVILGEPSGWLVDVDIDRPEALTAARILLPRTEAVFGRVSKPSSHWLYYAEGAKTAQFAGIEGRENMLVELRSTKGQTIFPPSVHKSSETIDWELAQEPGRVDADGLLGAVRLVAVATLIGLAWKDAAGRHHAAALALGGFLARCKVDPPMVGRVLDAVCAIAGDPDVQDRVRAARESAEKLAKGEDKITGATRLAEYFGEAVVSRLRQWFGSEGEGAIEKMNERFFRVNLGTTAVVAEPHPDGILLWPFVEFDKRFCHEKITVGKRPENVAKYWRESTRCARFERLVYAPPPLSARPEDYNAWRGFSVEPRPGDWSKNRDHIKDVVCAGDERVFEWVMDWCAALFQEPGRHAETALVLLGGQGVGKGHFVEALLGRSFDRRHFRHVSDRRRVYGDFNDVLSGCCLLFIDEATWGGDKRDAGIIKGLVTNHTIEVNRKHLPVVTETSMLHIVLASNETWPIGIDPDDRRFAVLRVSDARAQDLKYFGSLHEELAAGGRAAMIADLQSRAIDWSRLRQPPATDAKRDLKTRSMDPEDRWWFEKLHEGRILPADTRWEPEVPKDALYDDYAMCLQRAGASRRSFQTELGTRLRKLVPGLRDKQRRPDMKRWYEFPALAECRAAFEERMRSRYDWPAPEDLGL